jgi:hypothetical protein
MYVHHSTEFRLMLEKFLPSLGVYIQQKSEYIAERGDIV